MTRALAVLVCALLAAAGCAAPPTREDMLQTAITSGLLACETALNDPKTQWGPGAEAYCRRVVDGCAP